MAYTRVNWQDLPSTTTPRNATNLNNMDRGIKTNDDKLLGNEPMGNIRVDSISTKNLFDINGEVNVRGNTGTIEIGKNTVSNNVLTNYVNGNEDHAFGQKFTNLNGKTITFSAKVISFGSGEGAGIYIYDNNSLTLPYSFTNVINNYVSVTYTATSDNIIFGFATGNGTGAQFTDIQAEIGDTRTNFAQYQNLNIPTTSLFQNLNKNVPAPDDDLNKALVVGQYEYTDFSLNTPYTQNSSYDKWGIVIVMANSENVNEQYRYIFQIALGTSNLNNVYIRNNINSAGWTNWKLL